MKISTWAKISPNKKLLKEANGEGNFACFAVSFNKKMSCYSYVYNIYKQLH